MSHTHAVESRPPVISQRPSLLNST
jgi:hypothetical protein